MKKKAFHNGTQKKEPILPGRRNGNWAFAGANAAQTYHRYKRVDHGGRRKLRGK